MRYLKGLVFASIVLSCALIYAGSHSKKSDMLIVGISNKLSHACNFIDLGEPVHGLLQHVPMPTIMGNGGSIDFTLEETPYFFGPDYTFELDCKSTGSVRINIQRDWHAFSSPPATIKVIKKTGALKICPTINNAGQTWFGAQAALLSFSLEDGQCETYHSKLYPYSRLPG